MSNECMQNEQLTHTRVRSIREMGLSEHGRESNDREIVHPNPVDRNESLTVAGRRRTPYSENDPVIITISYIY